MANVEKSKTMNYHPGTIHTGMSKEAFSWRITGEGGHLPGAPTRAHPVYGMWGGVDGWVHELPSQTIEWNRDGY